MKFLPWKKQDYQPNFHFLHIAYYWCSTIVCLYPENHVEICLVIFFYQGNNFMLSIFVCLAALWNWALMSFISILFFSLIMLNYRLIHAWCCVYWPLIIISHTATVCHFGSQNVRKDIGLWPVHVLLHANNLKFTWWTKIYGIWKCQDNSAILHEKNNQVRSNFSSIVFQSFG